MNILMLNYEYPPLGGGAGVATKYLLSEFASRPDISIDLVTSSSDKARSQALYPNIAAHYLDIGKKGKNAHFQSVKDLLLYAWKSYFFSRKLISRKKYDFVHAIFGLPSGFTAMTLGMPYIVSLRGSDVPFHNPRFSLLDRLFFRNISARVWSRARFVIANSETLIHSAYKYHRGKEIFLIYNGVKSEIFHPSGGGSGDGGALRFLYVGRLSPVKGVNYLLDAFKICVENNNGANIELWIAGEGPMREDLEKYSEDNALIDKIRFLGRVDENSLPDVYRKCDVFVLPSINEGMPLAMIEAMSSGLAIICTDLPATKKIVGDGSNGFMAEQKNPESLADAMDKYIKQGKALAREHGKSSRAKSLEFDWKKPAAQYISFYERMLI